MSPVLSLSLFPSLSCRINTLVCTLLLWNNKCHTTMLRLLILYCFWLTEICICRNPRPTRGETCDLKIALPMTLMLPFFYISSTLYTRHICASFKLWGRPFCLSLLVSFFRCCNEKNSIHTTLLSHFISLVHSAHYLFFIQPGNGCWIHSGCSACIYSTLIIVSLNDEPWLAHWRQQSVGSAFNFTTMGLLVLKKHFFHYF